MARRSFRKSFRSFGSGMGKKLQRARSAARNNKKKAATLTTVALALGGFLVYEKFIKK